MQKIISRDTDKLKTYFFAQKGPLAIVTVSGLIYNIGLVAGPWFEGKMAQCLLDIFNRRKSFYDMLFIAVTYAAVIGVVQIARYFKRLYVRRFANNLNLAMKHVIYGNLIYKDKVELEQENIGSVMTKAISDVETCVEGMRKFTTEIFDTGVAMAGYFIFLLIYDWKLALLSMIFPPISYFFAEKMKTVVQKSNALYKESSGALNAATLDRVSGAITYRVFGCEEERNAAFEENLKDYEDKAIKADIWVSSMQPLYRIISMISVLFILYFGSKNVLGTGWSSWDIAAFTAFLSCYSKLAVKSSHAAKLFNAVHKASVSWKRIKPLMKPVPEQAETADQHVAEIQLTDLGFSYPDAMPIFNGLNLSAHTGQIIGITGPVACGKTSLGKTFLCEYPYIGSIKIDGKEMTEIDKDVRQCLVGYLGHDPEIMSASVLENVTLANIQSSDVQYENLRIAASDALLKTCLYDEIMKMPDGFDTQVGSSGLKLSGGQNQRLALARTICHYRPILILDDPFSALDKKTEKEIFENLKILSKDRIIFIISHRLYIFPDLDQVIWMNNGCFQVSDHEGLMASNEFYAELYRAQVKEADTYEK